VIEGILAGARRHGQDLLYFTGHPSGDIARSLPIYRDGRCDGLIHFAPGLADDTILMIGDSGLPVVLIGDSRVGMGVSSVDVDNVAAATEAVTYLISLGHRRIAMFLGPSTATSEHQRLAGYRRAHEAAGIPIDEQLIVPGMIWEVSGADRARALFALPASERPTALFCYNDAIALGVLRAAREAGVAIPGELSVIGFDDIDVAATTIPPLTTIRQPLRQVGERAVEILLAVISGERPAGSSEILPHELVIRASVGPVP
jgi:DNA-binding LacI/PurR family transcriptional regulator